MKILHVIPYMGCGGAEILLGKLALHQQKRGHTVEIVTLHAHHYTFEHYPNRSVLEEIIPITIISSRLKLLSTHRKDLREWKEILSRFQPNVIHAHLYEADVLAHSIFMSNVVYATHVHGPLHPLEKKERLPSAKKGYYELLETRWLRKRYQKCNTRFVAISNSMADYAKTLIPESLYKNIFLAQNAIETEKFPFRERKISSPVRLISVGNLVKKKNHDFLIQVMYHLERMGTNCRLEILGFGVEEKSLRQLITSLKLDTKVFLRGSVGNVTDYLVNADVYLHAAIPEPFGLAILEAMSTGLPPVTLDGGGNKDFILDGESGFIIPDKNIQSFAEKIIALNTDHQLYSSMSKGARAVAMKFNFESYTDRIMEIYSLKSEKV